MAMAMAMAFLCPQMRGKRQLVDIMMESQRPMLANGIQCRV
jgi:hypothetical protein